MTDDAQFLDALRADPTDATVLLVYADWLEERGDPRAEYIRLSQAPQENEARIEKLRRQIEPTWAVLIDGCCEKIGACIQAEVLRIDSEWQEETSEICKLDSVTITHRTLNLSLTLAFVGMMLLLVLAFLLRGIRGVTIFGRCLEVGMLALEVGMLALTGFVFVRLALVLPIRRFLLERRYRRAWRAYRQRRADAARFGN